MFMKNEMKNMRPMKKIIQDSWLFLNILIQRSTLFVKISNFTYDIDYFFINAILDAQCNFRV